MSFYRSDKLLREWAEGNLRRYLDPRRYPLIFDRLRAEKRSQRMTRIELGLLKIMLGDYRPERSQHEQKAYAESNAVRVVEIADALGCHASTVQRAKAKLNDLATAAASSTNSTPLILFHDLGVCIRATFWDAIRAKDFSENMGSAQLEAHANNIALSEEKRHDVSLNQENVRRFQSLSPREQAALLAAAATGTRANIEDALCAARADSNNEGDDDRA